MHLNKIKILLIGPSGSGKTSIANFISESINIEEAGPPKPTQGVRIVEFELSNINVNDKIYNNDIELWDCSGDHRMLHSGWCKMPFTSSISGHGNYPRYHILFESCWPALRVGVQGVILVCSPSTANAATREMELLYNYFVSQPKLTPKQCVLFYNCTEDQDDLESLNLSSTFSKVSQVAINLKTGGTRLKIDFSNFVISILQSINKLNYLYRFFVICHLPMLQNSRNCEEVNHIIPKFLFKFSSYLTLYEDDHIYLQMTGELQTHLRSASPLKIIHSFVVIARLQKTSLCPLNYLGRYDYDDCYHCAINQSLLNYIQVQRSTKGILSQI